MTHRRGATILEVLIAVSVTVMLSGMTILYGSAGRRQMNLYVDTVKLAQIILRAKSLSVLIYYNPSSPVCGYGVRVDPVGNSYALFRYARFSDETCDAITSVGDANYQELQRVSLARGVEVDGAASSINEVLFVPPDPKTYLWQSGSRVRGAGEIHLVIEGGEKVIAVNTGGQVTY